MSKPKFHTLRIADITKETSDCVSIAFDVPNEVTEDFKYLPGQYLTLRATIDGNDVRRSYSICSGLDEPLRVAIKQVEDGVFSTYANQVLQAGDELQVMTPSGNFTTDIAAGNAKNYVAFVAGSGITPVLSIMKTVLATEPNSQFTLFYGNQKAETVIFREVIEGLKNEHLGRLSLHHILSREHPGSELYAGRIDKEKCAQFCKVLIDPMAVDDYFICGPEAMIHAVRETLEDLNVEKSKIHFELFTSPTAVLNKKVKKKKKDAPEILSRITIIQDALSFDFDLQSQSMNVLDAALAGGADLPFACKGGVCATCKAKVMAGISFDD